MKHTFASLTNSIALKFHQGKGITLKDRAHGSRIITRRGFNTCLPMNDIWLMRKPINIWNISATLATNGGQVILDKKHCPKEEQNTHSSSTQGALSKDGILRTKPAKLSSNGLMIHKGELSLSQKCTRNQQQEYTWNFSKYFEL